MPRNSGRQGRRRVEVTTVVSKDVVEAIEKKPHATYIKYLLTKRCGPGFIVNELQKLGLSAPSRPYLIEYYNAQIDPLVKKNKLTKIYSDYKSKINGKLPKNKPRAEYTGTILNFKVDIGEADAITQANFCKFIKDLGVDSAWIWEITRFYGHTDNFPTDENGIRILSAGLSSAQLNKIASNKYRYIVEKLLLENLSNHTISKYCKETLKQNISERDIAMFKEVFFNTKLNGLDQNIDILEIELQSQQELLYNIRAGAAPYNTMSIGDKTAMERQVTQRINELDEILRNLKAAHSDLSYNTKAVATGNYKAMFEDVIARSYKKFCDYDQANDREIVNSLAKVAKIMSDAHNVIEKMESASPKGDTLDDSGVRQNLAQLQQQRLDEIEDEEKKRANEALRAAGLPELDDDLTLDDVGGVDELGMDFSNLSDDGNEE